MSVGGTLVDTLGRERGRGSERECGQSESGRRTIGERIVVVVAVTRPGLSDDGAPVLRLGGGEGEGRELDRVLQHGVDMNESRGSDSRK